ncbi:MAG: ABC transporter ATP-binding protein, partial [Bacteroidota bacterium]
QSGLATLIDVLTENLAPSNGEVKFWGEGMIKHRQRIGVLYDNISLFPRLKVKEIFHYLGNYLGIPNWEDKELVSMLGLDKIYNKVFLVLSAGERKKVGIYVALMGNPEFLILDEPTANLDPETREKFWRYIYQRKDLTVFFATHQWEEIKEFTNKVVFLRDGKMLAEAKSVNELMDDYADVQSKVAFPKFQGYQTLVEEERHYAQEDMIFVFPTDKRSFLQRLNKITPNFSITPLSIKDVYKLTVSS